MYLLERMSCSCGRDGGVHGGGRLCLLCVLTPGNYDVQVVWNVELRSSTILVRARWMLPSSD